MIIDKLLLLPITGPIAGIRWCLNQVVSLAEHEMMDDGAVKEQLLELQMALETGDIDDDEYVEREAVLMRRLREIRELRQRQAGKTDDSDPFISYS